MKRFFSLFVLFFFGFSGLNPAPASQTPEIPPLFTPLETQALPRATQAAGLVRERAAGLDVQALVASEQVRLNLFEDTGLIAQRTKLETLEGGSQVWTGKIAGDPYGEATFSITDGQAFGDIHTREAVYQVRFAADGVYRIEQIDPASFPSELSPLVPDTTEKMAPFSPGAATDDGSVVDILVVYDAAARTTAGSTTAMQNMINTAIAETNTGYNNSGVNFDMHLVHTAEVDYSEVGFNWSTTLTRLTGTSDGYMDEVHSLRDLYHADFVSLVVDDTAYCGLGWIMQTLSTAFAPYAFTVVSINCLTGYYSLAHEVGHNMGSAHDRANTSSGQEGVYTYSYGYQAPDKAFRTIMAYNCTSPGCTRVDYWSNPDVSYGGQPMGVLYTAPLAADNRRSLNNNALTFSNFRSGDSTAPTNPTSVDPGCTATNNVWQKACNNPSFTWSGASDGSGSGVAGYYYYWGTSASGTPATWTTSAGYDPPAVPNPSAYYLRVTTKDNAGNVSSPTTLFTLKYDASPPASAAYRADMIVKQTRYRVYWSGTDAGVGTIASYNVQYRAGSGGDWTGWLTNTIQTSADFGAGSPITLTINETYYFRTQATDALGNQETYPGGDGDFAFTVYDKFAYLPIVTK